jgi:NADH pyrophosphatase NudC (nudix superfamily)
MAFLTTILTYFGLAKPAQQRDHRWPAVAAAWLKEHPTCAACGSRKRTRTGSDGRPCTISGCKGIVIVIIY